MDLKLVVCGSIAHDRLMNFSGRYSQLIKPEKLEALSFSVLIDSLTETWGGVAANICYNSALLGNKPVLYGSAGQDASDYLSKLEAEGIDISVTNRSQVPTASFSVITDADNNQVGGFYPGAMADSAGLTFERWDADEIFVCLSAHDPATMRAQIDECQRRGIRLFYDPGQQVSNVSGEDLRAGIEAAEMMANNEYEFQLLQDKTGLSADELTAKLKLLIVTKGEKGSLLTGSSLEHPVEIAAAKPDQVVDPGGAGDAYRAGFLHGYLRQWELKKCGQLAATLSSFVVEQPTSQCEISLDAIRQRYQQTFNEEINL